MSKIGHKEYVKRSNWGAQWIGKFWDHKILLPAEFYVPKTLLFGTKISRFKSFKTSKVDLKYSWPPNLDLLPAPQSGLIDLLSAPKSGLIDTFFIMFIIILFSPKFKNGQ